MLEEALQKNTVFHVSYNILGTLFNFFKKLYYKIIEFKLEFELFESVYVILTKKSLEGKVSSITVNDRFEALATV